MKFSIAKDELVKILNIVLKGMASRSTLPILSGILLDAQDNAVTFQSTDLEISIKHTAAANVEEPGRAVIPGKLFSDIVKSLPDAAVSVAATTEQANITCLGSSFSLSALNPTDFPYFPDVEASMTVELPTKELADVVKRVSKAVSRDESRAILTGIQFTLEDNRVRLIATDSYRLAVAYLNVEGQSFEPFQAIIPGRTFEDVSKLAMGEGGISVGFSDNQVIFKFGDTVFVSRKIEGTYPNCMQLIPSSHEVSVKMDTAALTTAIKRVALLAQANTPVRFSFTFQKQEAVISAKTQDVGGALETVPASVDGADIEIAFNHQYVLDGLSSIDGDVVIELQTSLKPGILKSADNDDFIYLAMPVRLG